VSRPPVDHRLDRRRRLLHQTRVHADGGTHRDLAARESRQCPTYLPGLGDGAISYPRDRELSGSSPPDRDIWEKRPEDFPAWLVLSARLLAGLLTLTVIVLAVKYRWQ
jgi:hypothetical protein